MDLQSDRFGKYLLLERIGIGGMAEVFKAKTFGAEGFERLVAIKRILPNLVEDDDFVSMFIDEAKIAVRLSHPNIVGIHDLGKVDGTLFIAMEFVQGRDLRAIYDYESQMEGNIPVGIAAHIVMKMCEALHHAHFATGSKGEPLNVIHRDVSPQNVLVSYDGEVKVADFGLAKARGRMVQTQAGVVKGKLAYMSPEQLRGEEIDHRVDVFGLGIVLYELLSGERLFLGPSDMDTLRRVYEAKVPPLRDLNAEVHPDLEGIVRKALEKDRDKRYQTALELHDDLQQFVYGHGVYAGTSKLRNYMRDAFPEAAPPAAGLPPFARSGSPARRPESQPVPTPPTSSPPRPTFRPPKMKEATPPLSIPETTPLPSIAVGVVPAPPSAEQSGVVGDNFREPLSPFDVVSDDFDDLDDLPTDRPPPLDGFEDETRDLSVGMDELTADYSADPEAATQHAGNQQQPLGREHSGTVDRMPAVPPGLHQDEHPTHQPSDEASGVGATSQALAADEFISDGWEDDEPTVMIPGDLDLLQVKPSEDGEEEDPWGEDGDSTVVVDPRSTGS